MALQNSDLFVVERAGVQYHMTASEIADFVGAVRDYTSTNIADRDAGTVTPAGTLKTGDRVFVGDASADPTVAAGWAIYRVVSTGPLVFEKIQEQESMDVTISADLGYTAAPAQGTVTNSIGNDAIIPLVDATNAGLASPAMLANSHPAATAGLTAATNPINITAGQVATFGIAQLAVLP